ncbi:glycosyltransferase family 39 protein [Companilactobacillus insicii]|uniref:glycosyltransferase family 39 protein n=1 Tax=Companilactobacillus insicii TaxID=1732567 RepID=UPI001FE544A5|nr:glycosyltransferase family 39 protein [Companilactobacillus insicii]
MVFLLMLTYYHQNFLNQGAAKNVLIFLFFLAIITLFGYILIRIRTDNKKTNNIILISLLTIFGVTALIWALSVPNAQWSDFGNFWSRAPGYFQGDKLYQTDNDYFSKYAYQSGFMAYILGVIKIFGYNIIAVQLLNVIYQVLILLVTYSLAYKIFNNIKIARLSVLLLMIDLDWFALNSQADNQYLGSLLYLVTFWLLFQDKNWSYILAGVSLAAGCLIRPIGPVIIAGIIVYALIYILMKHKNYKSGFKILLTLAIYFILFTLAGVGIKASGINEYGLSNHDPEWKFLTGLNYQSGGTYSNELNKFIDPSKSRAEMSKVEKKQLKKEIKYLNDNNAWIKLFINKTQTLWSSRTLATDFTNYSQNHSQKTVEIINYLAYLGSIILIIFSWIGSLAMFKNKFDDRFYLLLLPLMAFAVANLIIEVQGRYRIEFLPIIAIMAGLGIYKLISTISGYFITKRN